MRQDQAQEWIQAVTGDIFAPQIFADKLKSGVTLCNLINAIKEGSVKKINMLSAPFMQMENISSFLK
jgi:transgelin